MKKFLFILISTLLIVSVLAVPCFATNEVTYGHYISPGYYLFDEVITGFGVNSLLSFQFESNGIAFIGLFFYPDTSRMIFVSGLPVQDNSSVVFNNGWNDDAYRMIYVPEGFFIYNSIKYSWWLSNLTYVDAGYESSFVDEVLSVFTFVGQWISGAASDLTAMFWTGSELTFVGILAVSALAIAVSFLIIGLISRFLRFRG